MNLKHKNGNLAIFGVYVYIKNKDKEEFYEYLTNIISEEKKNKKKLRVINDRGYF